MISNIGIVALAIVGVVVVICAMLAWIAVISAALSFIVMIGLGVLNSNVNESVPTLGYLTTWAITAGVMGVLAMLRSGVRS